MCRWLEQSWTYPRNLQSPQRLEITTVWRMHNVSGCTSCRWSHQIVWRWKDLKDGGWWAQIIHGKEFIFSFTVFLILFCENNTDWVDLSADVREQSLLCNIRAAIRARTVESLRCWAWIILESKVSIAFKAFIRKICFVPRAIANGFWWIQDWVTQRS